MVGLVAWGLLASALVGAPSAGAAPCSDVEVVFARGTDEPAGLGSVGQVFVDSLRANLGGRSVGAYAVNYPASNDLSTSAPAGARDLIARVQEVVAQCRDTKVVLGGYSQGAGVVDLATTHLPTEVSDRVAAVVDFGAPRSSFAGILYPGPDLPVIGPLYTSKSLDLCLEGDPVCFEGGWNMGAHTSYVQSGLVNDAVDFAASRVR